MAVFARGALQCEGGNIKAIHSLHTHTHTRLVTESGGLRHEAGPGNVSHFETDFRKSLAWPRAMLR